jgi:hypothetical protein
VLKRSSRHLSRNRSDVRKFHLACWTGPSRGRYCGPQASHTSKDSSESYGHSLQAHINQTKCVACRSLVCCGPQHHGWHSISGGLDQVMLPAAKIVMDNHKDHREPGAGKRHFGISIVRRRPSGRSTLPPPDPAALMRNLAFMHNRNSIDPLMGLAVSICTTSP